jgi:hypothetical protein
MGYTIPLMRTFDALEGDRPTANVRWFRGIAVSATSPSLAPQWLAGWRFAHRWQDEARRGPMGFPAPAVGR